MNDISNAIEKTLTKILNEHPSDEMLLEVYKEEMKFKSLILQTKNNIDVQKIKSSFEYKSILVENGYIEENEVIGELS